MIYQLPQSIWPWLYPVIILSGVACQLFSIWVNSKILLLAGLFIVLAGAFGEKDLALAIGDLLATGGLYFLQKKNSGNKS